MKFFNFLPGDDAPNLKSIRIRGQLAAFDDLQDQSIQDDEISFSIKRDVAFASYPNLEVIFSERLMSVIEPLRDAGRLVRLRGDGCAAMYAFFPRRAQIFDELAMNVRYARAVPGAAINYDSIVFCESIMGQEACNSASKGVLAGCFFSELFVQSVACIATRGFYLKAWEQNAPVARYVNGDLTDYVAGDERKTMRGKL